MTMVGQNLVWTETTSQEQAQKPLYAKSSKEVNARSKLHGRLASLVLR